MIVEASLYMLLASVIVGGVVGLSMAMYESDKWSDVWRYFAIGFVMGFAFTWLIILLALACLLIFLGFWILLE